MQLFKAAVAAWKEKRFQDAGINVGELVAIFIDAKKSQAVNVKPADLANFVRGIAEGMGQSMGDPTSCIRDIDVIIADFNAAFEDIVFGIKHISIQAIKRAILEFADGLQAVAASFEACGIQKAADDISAIVKEIKEGKLIEVIAREVIHIIFHEKELVELFKSAAQNWRNGAFIQSGRDTGMILAILLETQPKTA